MNSQLGCPNINRNIEAMANYSVGDHRELMVNLDKLTDEQKQTIHTILMNFATNYCLHFRTLKYKGAEKKVLFIVPSNESTPMFDIQILPFIKAKNN